MTTGILLEGYGGNISWQAISAKTGQGVQELLDLILLAAELENLEYDSKTPAKGIIIEALVDNRRGMVVSVIVENGTLRVGENIATATASGKIKSLENFLGERVNNLEPSAPALILGFESLPQIGEEFSTGESALALSEAVLPAVEKASVNKAEKNLSADRQDSEKIKIILKADNAGSLEALADILKTIPSTKPVEILDQSVGRINEGDFKSAVNSDALIIGFRVKLDQSAESLQKLSPVKMITSDIIYELVKKFEDHLNSFGTINVVGELEILAIFASSSKNKQIVGGRISQGKIKNQQKFEVWRNEQSIAKGRIVNLQEKKKDVSEAETGKEVGLLVEADDIIKTGDKLKFYELSKPAGS